MNIRKCIVFSCIALWLAVSSAADAQGLAQLVGSVNDPSGSVVPGANVTVTEVATGLARSVVTGAEGFYSVPSLRPTDYKVTVEANGFRAITQGVKLEADQAATVKFQAPTWGSNRNRFDSGKRRAGRYVYRHHQAGGGWRADR